MLGDISAIATLILFVFYFIGRFWIIRQETKTLYEEIEIHYGDNTSGFKIVDSYDIGEIIDEHMFFVSKHSINWMRIYEYNFVEKRQAWVKGKIVMERGYLQAGLGIEINTLFPECGFNYLLEYERYDYSIGYFAFAYNGKNEIYEESIIMRATLKSYLYYLVK